MEDYYKILGLDPDADKEAIKKAYRKLAMKYHPDVNPGPGAKDKFMKVLEAYEYLMGMRKARAQENYKPEDLEKLREILEKMARERAKNRYRERASELRKEKEKEQSRQYTIAIYTLIGIVVLYFSISAAWNWFYNMKIDSDPAYTIAKVSGIGQNNMIYTYRIGDSILKDEKYVRRDNIRMLAKNGMPLSIGDEFEMIYRKSDPSYQRINFEKLSAATMNRYVLLVSNEIQDIYEEEWRDWTAGERKRMADCITLFLYKEYQFEGLSTIVFRESFFLENFSNNSIRWYFMRTSEKYESILENCYPQNKRSLE